VRINKMNRNFLLPLFFFFFALIYSLSTAPLANAQRTTVARTPPMGWNSWDSYGRTLNEESIKANANWIAKNLKRFGWQYVVVDEGWYLANLNANDNSHVLFEMDEYGRYVPVPARFPTAGKSRTFKPLADYLHSLGLKFGLHIIRGIPREAVEKNLPVAGSSYHAKDAADTSDVCPWNTYNYGLKPSHPASQAYYDSLAQQYASWGVDFVKIDCIADHPYKADEIRMFSEALKKVRRPIVLSLSPGPTSIDKKDEVARYSQMWRISDDVWDVWYSSKGFPQGVKNQFARAALWAEVATPGHWPDADMLPIGSLHPAAGWGEPRNTRLTHDEQRTMLTLWSIFRSPLIMGGNLTEADDWTASLLTNAEVIAVDQHSRENKPVITAENVIVWTARPESGARKYLAVFNVSDSDQVVKFEWKELGLSALKYQQRDLWERRKLGVANRLELTLRPHASVLYEVSAVTR
jgi:alpha-galactosidase